MDDSRRNQRPTPAIPEEYANPFFLAPLLPEGEPSLSQQPDRQIDNGPLDRDHRTLFALSRRLQAEIASGRPHEQLVASLDQLIECALAHIAREESILLNAPEAVSAPHFAEHRKLIWRLLEAQHRFARGAAQLSSELFISFDNWLAEHIEQSDRTLPGIPPHAF